MPGSRFAPSTNDDELLIREAAEADRATILQLLSASLGWEPDERFARFFEWKHLQSPFGRSPAWVAVAGGAVVGFRTFVRWELDHPDGRVRRAVRAVDTATHPDHQGRGIFRRLTQHALDELGGEEVDLVFNTPNDSSRPGYLKMGWHQVGRLPTAVRPTGLTSVSRILRARVPADHWSLPSKAADPAPDLLRGSGVSALLASQPAPSRVGTCRTPEYLRWRYGLERLAYRAIAVRDDPASGLAVFRLRRRGDATEATLCEVLAPGGDRRVAAQLERGVARVSGADYVIRLGGSPIDTSGFIRLPGQGPILTTRSVADQAPHHIADWDLTLGDVELF